MKTVAVLSGGPSSEHDISLLTGINVAKALKGKYKIVPIFISQIGAWFVKDKKDWFSPEDALDGIDIAFNALHGEYGEDGKIQATLDSLNIPYTGSTSFPSSLAMNKYLSGKTLAKAGLSIPKSILFKKNDFNEGQVTRKSLELSSFPQVVKPVGRGSSVGVSIVKDMRGLLSAFKKAFRYDNAVLLQKYIKGREVTCTVLENFKGEKYFALPPIEIIPPKDHDFFDYKVKYDGSTQEICPADFYDGMMKEIRVTAIKAHKALHLRHYSRVDMILDGTKLYVLEVNTLPGLTKESLTPKSANAIGLKFPDLLDHIIRLAII